MTDEEFLSWFGQAVARLPGVRAVTLGGSRARGEHRPDSDWDFALYYRGAFDPAVIRAEGWQGEVSEVGGWGGGIMNGGAWLRIDGRRVDLHYRDLDQVEYHLAEAREGRFGKEFLMFYLAGVPTYLPVAELAINRVLSGELPKPDYPLALRDTAYRRWHDDALMTLAYAEGALRSADDVVVAVGNLARAIVEESHARLAQRGEWTVNEKRMVARAGLSESAGLLGSAEPGPLRETVTRIRAEFDGH